ncbi:MAG: polysaccharide pyruvyl transferase family protein [Paludibacteraceae bacterium]|nr:polysaccharide pyruvyl transferase family protein [Paludibacteraceae bacterium]
MKIKTITCHDVYNYGASLQAFALMSFLRSMGHEVEIIDYLPRNKRRRYEYFRLAPTGIFRKIATFLPFLEPLLALWQNRYELLSRNRKYNFDLFKKEALACTSRKYESFEDLNTYKPEADIFVAGSDQIWNVYYDNGRDPSFYCAFEPDTQKRMSYAASFGANTIPEDSETFVKEMLSRMKAISVREYSGVKIVEQLGLKAQHVLDPVFLLETEEWRSMCRKDRGEEGYVLVYDFLHNDPNVETLSKFLAKKYNKKIVSINDFRPLGYADVNVNDAGPIEFLEYIKDADFVVSTSFHATAFSVIFSRPFYTLPLVGHGNSSRMVDFLNMLDLEDRFVTRMEQFREAKDIDYEAVHKSIGQKRLSSISWLLSQLQ